MLVSPWLMASGCGTGGRRDVYLKSGDTACSASTLKHGIVIRAVKFVVNVIRALLDSTLAVNNNSSTQQKLLSRTKLNKTNLLTVQQQLLRGLQGFFLWFGAFFPSLTAMDEAGQAPCVPRLPICSVVL